MRFSILKQASLARIFQSSLETEAGMVSELVEEECRFQNSPVATLGRMDGTLKGCLLEEALILWQGVF